ncbi:NAD-dependent epimerase/dehydratase family protein [Chryseobacterium wanjuense]
MKEVVLITGAGGMIARELSKKLEKDYTVRFLTRKKQHSKEFEWDIRKGIMDDSALENVSHIIHLAGLIFLKNAGQQNEKKN